MATTLKMEETFKEREIARTIKEPECYVGIESDSERTPERSSYTLPDGNVISLGEAPYRVPEALFDPALLDIPGVGMHEMTYNSVMRADLDAREGSLRQHRFGKPLSI